MNAEIKAVERVSDMSVQVRFSSCAAASRFEQSLLQPEQVAAQGEREAVEGDVVMQWQDGCPPFPWNDEWFIALTKYGDKVVLTRLPKEYSYDYKTADDTYMKAENIVKWMQFPDSEYRSHVTQQPASHERTTRWREIEKDAARYQWLREQPYDYWRVWGTWTVDCGPPAPNKFFSGIQTMRQYVANKNALDSAIDAAMSAAPQANKEQP